jgi:hypothetical protein
MWSMLSLYKKPWRLFKEIGQGFVSQSENVVQGSSTVEDFIVSGECYNCLCVIVMAIVKL